MVKFETVFNRETTKSLNKAAFKKYFWLFLVLSTLLILMGIMGIVEGITYPEEGDLAYGIFMLAFGVLFFPLVYVLTHFLQKNVDKTMNLLSDETKESYVFTQDKIYVNTVQANDYSANVVASYKYLYKIIEDKNTIYLYISKMQSHVIQKKYLTEGSLEELTKFFETNFNTVKYKRDCTIFSNK